MPSFIRNPKDFFSGLLFLAAGLGFVWLARDYGLGTARRMGPGYFPTVLGALLALIGLGVAGRSLMGQRSEGPRLALKPLATVLGSAVLFGLLIRGAGLLVAVAVLVGVSALASTHSRLGSAVALSIGLAAFAALVFVQGLGLPLPLIGPWFGG